MATVGGKTVTMLTRSVFNVPVVKGLLYKAPAAGLTRVFIDRASYLSGPFNISLSIFHRAMNPFSNSFDGATDFQISNISLPISGAPRVLEVVYEAREDGKFLFLLPGEELRFTSGSSGSFAITFGTVTDT